MSITAKENSYGWKYACDNKILVKEIAEEDIKATQSPDPTSSPSVEPEKKPSSTPTIPSDNNNPVANKDNTKAPVAAAITGNTADTNVNLITIGKINKFKAKKLKKKSISFMLNVKSSGEGDISFKIIKGKGKYISVSKAGKVTLKKGIKNGTYKICVTASETSKYTMASRIVNVKVR